MPEGGDWTVKAVDTVDSVVGLVRDKAVVPITTTARWVVYGLLAAFVGLMAAVLFAAGLVRGLAILAEVHLEEQVWVAHLVTGGIFALIGMFLWRKRRPKKSA